MIEYDEGYWGVAFAFRLRGSVVPRATVWGIACAVVSAALHFYLTNQRESDAEGAWQDDVASDALGGFTFAMGFLLVMRTQKGYTRWWEGGTLLQQVRGEWFNAVSNLMAFCRSEAEQQVEVEKLQHLLVRLFSLLYGNALMQVSTMRDNCFEFLSLEGFDAAEIEQLNSTHDSCELVLQWIQRVIVEASNAGTIKIAPPILSRVYNQLGNGIVKLNNARKIRDFPVPFSLAQLVTFMLLIHWISTAVICAVTINSTSMCAAIAFTVIAPLWGINYMAVELENPYGDDPNDLPLHAMQRDLNRSLKALLQPSTLKPPSYNYDPETDKPMRMEKMDIQTAYHAQYNRVIRCKTKIFPDKEGLEDEEAAFDLLHGGSKEELEDEQIYTCGKSTEAYNGTSCAEVQAMQVHNSGHGADANDKDSEKPRLVAHELRPSMMHLAALPESIDIIPYNAGIKASSSRRSSMKEVQKTRHTERFPQAQGDRNQQHNTGAHPCFANNRERSSDEKAYQLVRVGSLTPLDLSHLQRREGPRRSYCSSNECPGNSVQNWQSQQVHDHSHANRSATPLCIVNAAAESNGKVSL